MIIRRKNKKAWLRIVEAFISIMLIFTVLMIIVARQQISESREDELVRLQRFVLKQIIEDTELRNQVLNNDTSGVKDYVNNTLPNWIDYNIKICKYNDICGLGYYVEGEIYTDEVLIVSNLTYFNPDHAYKLKLFFWER